MSDHFKGDMAKNRSFFSSGDVTDYIVNAEARLFIDDAMRNLMAELKKATNREAVAKVKDSMEAFKIHEDYQSKASQDSIRVVLALIEESPDISMDSLIQFSEFVFAIIGMNNDESKTESKTVPKTVPKTVSEVET